MSETNPPQRQPFKTYVPAILIVAASALAFVVARENGLPSFSSADASVTSAPEPAPDTNPTTVAAPPRYTKAEFETHVLNKTKAEIRSEFGPPLLVHDDLDEWFYGNLPVYDADAGIQVGVSIRFAGLADGSDFVVGARYQ